MGHAVRHTLFKGAPLRRFSLSAQRSSANVSSWADRMTSASSVRTPKPANANVPSPIQSNKDNLPNTPEQMNPASQMECSLGYDGIGIRPFPSHVAQVLCEPIQKDDVEIKPDGLLYLPEIKYRRILNRAFGPGGWGLKPQGEPEIAQGILSREWTLICLGRFVSTARGEQEFFRPNGVPTANEGAKSNALMRCCKDLGIASELWDPRFVRQFKAKHCVEVWCQTADGKKYVYNTLICRKKYWRRRDDEPFQYPAKEVGTVGKT